MWILTLIFGVSPRSLWRTLLNQINWPDIKDPINVLHLSSHAFGCNSPAESGNLKKSYSDKRTAPNCQTFFIMRALQPNIIPVIRGWKAILSTSVFIFCWKKVIKTAGQNTLVWVNINRSSSLFLLDPCAWKQWVVGHFISRKQACLPVHIVSMTAIYFATVARQVYVMPWRLLDKNNRKYYFLILNVPKRCSACWYCCLATVNTNCSGCGPKGRAAICSEIFPPAFLSLSLAFCILPSSPSPRWLRWLYIS